MVCQVLWFSCNYIARIVQHLETSTLEFTTLAFVLAMLAPCVCWRDKPANVGRPIILNCNSSIAGVLKAAGDDAKQPYKFTPLDVVSRFEWSGILPWSYNHNVLRQMHILLSSRRTTVRPINWIPNENFPFISSLGMVWVGMVSLAYSATFVSSWNFPFPSNVERELWRIASIDTIIMGFLSIPLQAYLFRIKAASLDSALSKPFSI